MTPAPERRRPPVPAPLGWPLAAAYRAVITRINRRFDRGRGVVRFDRPVISVGNLTVGGTGKTPMVAFLVRTLLDAGHRPCIAMRGYARGRGESDEAAEYRRLFPEVPIVARADRALGLIRQFSAEYDAGGPHTDCIVLDDGFQHRQIARDLDIVLIDATHDPFQERLLPAGWLREPVRSLSRAGAVVITHAEAVQPADLTALDRKIAEVRSRGADAVARHAWRGLRVFESGQDRAEPVSWLSGRRTFAVCAIGNPAPFLNEARRVSSLAGQFVRRDHDPYATTTLRRLFDMASKAQPRAILTTEKDWSKLAKVRPELWPAPVARPVLAMTFDRGGEALAARVLDTVARGAPE